jgi:AraC family transcriptional regulator, transcriptional activator FtrA
VDRTPRDQLRVTDRKENCDRREDGRRLTVSALTRGTTAFELGMITEIFGIPLSGVESCWYELAFCAHQLGRVPILGGAAVEAKNGLDVFAEAHTVIVAGDDPDFEHPDEVLDAIRVAYRRGSRIVSLCAGTFALAAAGILNSRRATTHWMFTDLLAERYPDVHVQPETLYVEDGNIYTSAGGAAGLDLCVHLIRDDFGAAAANAMARRLIIASHREGYHAQPITRGIHSEPEDDRLTRSMDWALSHLGESITVDSLADRAHMSSRTYLRHFTKVTGTSPIRWLMIQRIRASLPLLEATTLSIEKVAAKVGFDHAATYRYHFRRTMGTSPTAYRKASNGEPVKRWGRT